MPPTTTPRITVGPSQLASSTPSGMDVRRFTPSGGEDLLPSKTQRCLEIGPLEKETPSETLHPKVVALRTALAAIPGVHRINILNTYMTVEVPCTVSWVTIYEAVGAVLKQHMGWPEYPVFKTNASEAN